jgi:type III secretory pathway lipoprotein EscJ
MVNLQNIRWQRYGASFFLLAAISVLTACGEKSIAETDDESEANRMFDILYSNRLHVEKKSKTGEKPVWEIVVDEGLFGDGEAAVATQVLNDHGLPRPKDALPPTTNAYGMESPEEGKKRQNREKEIQIENQLYSTLPGVIRVKVIVAQPVNDILSIEKTPPTASVSIVQTEPEAKFTIPNVQSLVAGSVPNLKPENINVAVSQQILREIPLERLAAQRRSNMIFALGSGLIILLIAALAAVWYAVKRRKKQAESETKQLAENRQAAEIEANGQYALNSADDDNF